MLKQNRPGFYFGTICLIFIGVLGVFYVFSLQTFHISHNSDQQFSEPVADVIPSCPHKFDLDNVKSFQSQTKLDIISEIQNKWLRPPSQSDYNFIRPALTESDYLSVQKLHDVVLNILKNKTNGFFIECGAYDGVWLSNTLHLEQDYGWTGLLIEADPSFYRTLIAQNRKAWTINACLAIEPFPGKVKMIQTMNAMSVIASVDQNNRKADPIAKEFEIQCFPLASMLAALGQTVNVDYLSLDIEGAELKVLQTIPWDFVYIKVISLEANLSDIGPVKPFLESKHYKLVDKIEGPWIHDLVFVHQQFANEIGMSV